MKTLGVRWLKFNLAGALGIVIQLSCLAIFKDVLHLHYLLATAIAVEIAVLHNFIWHQRFTWKDRPGTGRDLVFRLLRFHLGNGLISVAGNLAIMRLLTGSLGLYYVPANAIAIAVCSLANFAAGEWFVFRTPPDDRSATLRKAASVR